MLQDVQRILACRLHAHDGDLGSVTDLYFDDHAWTVRYLVVDTGHWLPGRQVLIVPQVVTRLETPERMVTVNLSVEQVRQSPGIESDRPVGQQQEDAMLRYFGWASWREDGMGQIGVDDVEPAADDPAFGQTQQPPGEYLDDSQTLRADPHLRSVSEVKHYRIAANDGHLGKLTSFIVDTADDAAPWTIRYLVIDAGSWLASRPLILPPYVVRSVDWEHHDIVVNLSRDQIQAAPAYDPAASLDRDYERHLHAHYKLPTYWR